MDLNLVQSALYLLIYLLAISLGGIFIGGVFAGIFKMVTGIDDSVVGIVCRISALIALLYFFGGHLSAKVSEFAQNVWGSSSNYY